jgi:3-dehydroquinate dehydratase/shikimate dehydrogenase
MIHNRGFTALGIDAVYLPFQVPDLGGFWKVAEKLHIRGLSVTIPHKEAVLGRDVRADEIVRAVGACNTLTRPSGKGRWNGTNTDAEGFLGPLRAALSGTISPGLRATVIGAGGAARSVVAALKSAGASVLVLTRTTTRARTLAEQLGVISGGIDAEGLELAKKYSDVVVQTTSVGMTPNEDADPAPGLDFTGREIVYELVYAPERTRFVRRAITAGCRVLYGRQMLIAQALRQFLLFTGVEYPPELVEGLNKEFD